MSARSLTVQELEASIAELEQVAGQRIDLMTVLESRLFDQRISKYMVPTEIPVPGTTAGSTFGFRIDPFTGQSALHAGLDFPAPTGSDIVAAAGGVVVTQEFHPAFGNMVELDHGNQLVTRYAHLHFEVLVQGVPQNPQKFLSAGSAPQTQVALQAAAQPARSAGR